MGVGHAADEGGRAPEPAPQLGAHVEAGRSIGLVVAAGRDGRRVDAEAVARLRGALGPARVAELRRCGHITSDITRRASATCSACTISAGATRRPGLCLSVREQVYRHRPACLRCRRRPRCGAGAAAGARRVRAGINRARDEAGREIKTRPWLWVFRAAWSGPTCRSSRLGPIMSRASLDWNAVCASGCRGFGRLGWLMVDERKKVRIRFIVWGMRID